MTDDRKLAGPATSKVADEAPAADLDDDDLAQVTGGADIPIANLPIY